MEHARYTADRFGRRGRPSVPAAVRGLRGRRAQGEKMPRTDFDTAFESHRVAFAADLSAAEGRTVKLSEMKF